jgi:hypothetical protein
MSTTGTTAEIDLRAQVEHEAVTTKIGDLAAYLQEHLGQKMTAYLGGIDHPKTVGLWVAGKSSPRDLPSMRLRYAYQVSRILIDAYDDETARAWFFGSNSRLDDEAPAYLLRHGTRPDDLRRIIPAAYAFVEVAG